MIQLIRDVRTALTAAGKGYVPLIEASLTLTLDGVSNDLVPYVDTQHYPRVLIAVDSRTITGKPTVAAWQATLIWQEVHGQGGSDISRIRQDALSTFDRVYNYLTTRLSYTPGTKVDGDTRYFTDGQSLVYYASIITVSAKVDTDMCCDGPYTPIPVPPTQSFCAAVRECVGSLYDRVRELEEYNENICANLEEAGCGGGGTAECDGVPVCDILEIQAQAIGILQTDLSNLETEVDTLTADLIAGKYQRYLSIVRNFTTNELYYARGTGTTVAITNLDTIWFTPFYFGTGDPAQDTVTAFGLGKTATAAGTANWAIYDADPTNYEPTTLLAEAVATNTTATGIYFHTLGSPLTLTPGKLYYFAVKISANGSYSMLSLPGMAAASLSATSAGGNNSVYFRTGQPTANAFPVTATTGGPLTAALTPVGFNPLFKLA